jgi:hypothetical protein
MIVGNDHKTCNVYLNGIKIKHAFYADDIIGEVHLYESDSNGNILVVNDEIVVKKLKGRVEIREE